MDMNREALLREIMAVDFSAIDLHLYLNTHPYDQKAIAIYNDYVQKSKMLHMNYEKMYGPLTAGSPNPGCKWRWIESPWPWEC